MDEVAIMEMKCLICFKDFDKYSTFKRHGYYCRSKPPLQRISRGKACITCVSAKVRCNAGKPECCRCVAKNLRCQYQARKDTVVVSVPESSGVEVLEIEQLPNGGEEIAPVDLTSFDRMGSDLTIAPASNTTQFSTWATFDNYSISGPWSWPLNTYSTPGIQLSTPISAIIPHCPSLQPTFNAPTVPYLATNSLTSETTLSFGEVRPSLSQYPLQPCGSPLMRILYSYPKMMLRPETFPHFIHPLCFPEGTTANPESIVNCMSLMQLFESGNHDSRKLVWRMILSEQERLASTYASYSRWELLASMQALLIYVLLRFVEGQDEEDHMDVPLLSTIQLVGQTLVGKLRGRASLLHDISENHSWKEWIFEESRKRTAMVFRILDIVLNLGMSVCETLPPDFVLGPLPARKLLWEASSFDAWNVEMSWSRGQDQFGLLNNGTLVRLAQGEGLGLIVVREDDDRQERENWQHWCAGMDGFGSLIMIAASLL